MQTPDKGNLNQRISFAVIHYLHQWMELQLKMQLSTQISSLPFVSKIAFAECRMLIIKTGWPKQQFRSVYHRRVLKKKKTYFCIVDLNFKTDSLFDINRIGSSVWNVLINSVTRWREKRPVFTLSLRLLWIIWALSPPVLGGMSRKWAVTSSGVHSESHRMRRKQSSQCQSAHQLSFPLNW